MPLAIIQWDYYNLSIQSIKFPYSNDENVDDKFVNIMKKETI